MKFLFNFVSLLVLIAYCLYSDGAKMNQQAQDAQIKASLKKAKEKVDAIESLIKVKKQLDTLGSNARN